METNRSADISPREYHNCYRGIDAVRATTLGGHCPLSTGNPHVLRCAATGKPDRSVSKLYIWSITTFSPKLKVQVFFDFDASLRWLLTHVERHHQVHDVGVSSL